MSNTNKPNISLDSGFHFNEVNPATSNPVDLATHSSLLVNPALGRSARRPGWTDERHVLSARRSDWLCQSS
jgi:hypothetical protein